MKIVLRLSLAAIALTLFFNVLAVTEVRSQIFREIFKRMEAHQKSLSSLRSKVRMEKYNVQLDEIDVSEGTVIYSRSSGNQISARIEWTKPVTESLYSINGQYVLYRPRVNQAIIGKIDKTKGSAKFLDALSFLSMSKKEILANFSISYIGQEKVKEIAAWHLIFTPKKADIYKSAELWIDASGMPILTKVLEQNGDSTTVLFSDFRKNGKVGIADFRLRLPKGVKIIKASNDACPCYKPDNAKDALRDWSDAVFSGKVIALNGADYIFKTERMWKDSISSEVVVRDFSTKDDCAIKLTVGERYVAFTEKVKVDGKTVLGLMPCNLTSNLISDSGKKVLKEIGPGKPVKNMTIRKKRRQLKSLKTTRFETTRNKYFTASLN